MLRGQGEAPTVGRLGSSTFGVALCFPEEKYAMRTDEVLRILAKFRDLRRDEFGIVRIVIFGSLARDEMADTSTVDVVVSLSC